MDGSRSWLGRAQVTATLDGAGGLIALQKSCQAPIFRSDVTMSHRVERERRALRPKRLDERGCVVVWGVAPVVSRRLAQTLPIGSPPGRKGRATTTVAKLTSRLQAREGEALNDRRDLASRAGHEKTCLRRAPYAR